MSGGDVGKDEGNKSPIEQQERNEGGALQLPRTVRTYGNQRLPRTPGPPERTISRSGPFDHRHTPPVFHLRLGCDHPLLNDADEYVHRHLIIGCPKRK